MDKDVLLSMISLIGTIASPLFGYLGLRIEKRRNRGTQLPAARPGLVFVVCLSAGLALTALVMALVRARVADVSEVVIAIDTPTQNTTKLPIFLAGICDIPPPGSQEREITGRLSPTLSAEMPLVAAAQGPRLLSFQMIVPPGWFYKVRTASGPPCAFRGWTF